MRMDTVGWEAATIPDAEVDSTALDYWSFVTLAKQKVGERLNNIDADPSHLALSLNRASGIITHVTESAVHRPLKLNWSAFRMLFVLWVAGEIEQSKLALLTNSRVAMLLYRVKHFPGTFRRPTPIPSKGVSLFRCH